ncbi:MAG TPA: hypothetical protein VFA18_24925 [Gemmataceae bacterium]|nr:hypothetical protein [Gemmataceae bacterium]
MAPAYALVRDHFYILGHLDAIGDFVPDVGAKRFPLPGPEHPRKFQWLNVARKPNEPVYEFRCGKLIRGVLNKEGNFVPETGSTPIDFKDYRHGKDALRIYNLPGRFVKTGQ